MKCTSILTMFMVALFVIACVHAQPSATQKHAPAEVRGTWLTTTANDAIATSARSAASMAALRDIGLNTVYVETWKNGYTQFPSPTQRALLGIDRHPNLLPATNKNLQAPRDLLEETLIAAHRHGLHYIAWFEYGFMAAFKDTHNTLRKNHPDWMMTTADGSLVSRQNPFVWMNPLRPEAQNLLIGIMKDAVLQYDLDGVQLDDRIAWPVSMGYDPYTREVYAREHEGRQPPDNMNDPQWMQWRAKKISAFAQRMHDELRKVNPNVLLSISPAPYPWCYDNYLCDWPTWVKGGLMDEYIPQLYRDNYPRIEREWPEQLALMGPRGADLIAGLRVVGEGPDTPWNDLQQMVQLLRRQPGGGHVWWFSRGVLQVYPQQLKAFYDVGDQGHAPHPKRPVDWRPLPLVAQKVEGQPGTWQATITTPGRYRTIVRSGDVWVEAGSAKYEAGRVTLTVNPLAEAVELLVDRRPESYFAQAKSATDLPRVNVTVRIDDVFMRESDIEPMSVQPFLDVAEKHGAKVILNVIPQRLQQSTNATGRMSKELQQAIARGHEVMQHGMDHQCRQCNDTGHEFTCTQTGQSLDAGTLQNDIAKGKAMIQAATGKPVLVYGGIGRDVYTPALYQALQANGFIGVSGAPEPRHALYGLTCIPTGSDYAWGLQTRDDVQKALQRVRDDFHKAVRGDTTPGYFQLNFHDHFVRPGWHEGITLRFLDEALTWLRGQSLAQVRFVVSSDLF